MKIAIMQPYLFPYLGYYQLIRAVDAFVVYDDVNYIQRGWINRNNILNQGKAQLITLEIIGGSQNKLINQILVGNNRVKFLRTLKQNYSKAPEFSSVFPLLEEVLMQQERNLASYLYYALRRISDYLGLHPQWHMASSLHKNNALRGQEKVLSICEELKATHYINLPGGEALYDRESFSRRGVCLSFIHPRPVNYSQFGREFVPNLSIIDVMMFNDKEACSRLLQEYEII